MENLTQSNGLTLHFHKEKRRLKDYSQLQQLKVSCPDSTDIFEDNLIDTFYLKRLSELCLYDFVKDYTCNPQQGRCGYRQLTKSCIPNHKLLTPAMRAKRRITITPCFNCLYLSEMKAIC